MPPSRVPSLLTPHSRTAAQALAAAALLPGLAAAGVITDKAEFNAFPRTLITFETRGGGVPVNLPDGATLSMPPAEYTGVGLTFNPVVQWVNDAGADFEAAQAVGGSPEIGIAPFAGAGPFNLDFFAGNTRSVGLLVIWNNTAPAATAPTLRAFGAGNILLETVQLGPAYRDGTVGVADYGFLGLFNAQPILRLEIAGASAIYDDLILSPETIPAPGGGAVLVLAAAVLGPRRRR
jgi:uncharacterized protein (TIGR03382 family)